METILEGFQKKIIKLVVKYGRTVFKTTWDGLAYMAKTVWKGT